MEARIPSPLFLLSAPNCEICARKDFFIIIFLNMRFYMNFNPF